MIEAGGAGNPEALRGLLDEIGRDMGHESNKRRSIRQARRAERTRETRYVPNPDEWRAKFQECLDSGLTDVTIGYWRISTAHQADGEGPESQQQSVIAWATPQTVRGIDLWVFDVDSGKEESRQGLDFLVGAMKTGRVSRVVVQKLDRLARNNLLAERVNHAAWQSRTQLCSATEHIPDGAVGTLFRQILQAFNQYEATLIVWRMASGKKVRVRREGTYNGGEVPYGYLAAGRGHMLVCEPEARIIRLIFDLYSRGYNQTAISDFLNRSGIPTRLGGQLGWRQGQIRRILRHEKAYRAEGLFSPTVESSERIAHAPILPHRPEEERTYLFGTVRTMPRASVPDDLVLDRPTVVPVQGSLQQLTPAQARSLATLYRLRDEGLSISAIQSELNRLGLRSLSGKPWSWTNVQTYMSRRERYEAALVACQVEPCETIVDLARLERDAVKRIHDLRSKGLSYPLIQHTLESEGVRTARGAVWSLSSIQRVLKGQKRQAIPPSKPPSPRRATGVRGG